MLTVKEINEVSFGKAGFSGYKPEDVDNFIDKVAASFHELITERDAAIKQAGDLSVLNTELTKKNADAQRKLSVLAQKVETYRLEEEGIKEAIISAQRMSKSMVQEAEQKAANIVGEARAQAEAKLLEANEEARRITQNAENEAAKSAKEYANLAETKKIELEEIKKQVTAFRSSLLEMYKKHLECIDHIPTFRQKDEPEDVKQTVDSELEASEALEKEPELPIKNLEPEPIPEPEPLSPAFLIEPEPELEPKVELKPEPEPEPKPIRPVQEYRESVAPRPFQPPQTVRERPAPQPRNVQPVPKPAPRQNTVNRPQEQPKAQTLNDTYNYVQEQLQPSRLPESYLEDNDLSSVGIDLNAHTNIPEALRREKSTNYSNLPFGDGVEVDGRKRKR